MKLSIIVPVENNSDILKIYNDINSTLKKIKYEIIYVSCNNNEELNKIYDNDIVHVRIIYLNNVYSVYDMVNVGIESSCGEYSIVIDDKYNIEYLYEMISILDNDNDIDIVSTGFYIENKHYYKEDSYGYRMFRDIVKETINMIGYTNDVFTKIGFNTKYLDRDKKEIKYSFIKELINRSNKIFKVSLILSIIFILVSLISLIFRNIMLFSIWFGFSILIFLIGYGYKDINNKKNIIIKRKIGFSEKNIL